MKRISRMSIWTGVMVMAAMVSACDTADRSASETRETGGVAAQATEAVTDAGRAVGDAVLDGGRAADAAFETVDVKSALSADARVDAGDINVDTDHISKTVTLKGRVPTAAQKALAEEIAVKRAVGYRVENQLIVGT
jgi:hypothetical protein